MGSWSSGILLPEEKSWSGFIEQGENIYCIGGKKSFLGMYLDTLDVFDATLNTWVSKRNMGTAKSEFGCILYEGKIYCFGGIISGQTTSRTDVYHIEQDIWTVGNPVPVITHGMGCVLVFGLIYCIGGASSIPQYYNSVRIWNPRTEEWTVGAPMPTPRERFGCVAIGSNIYCIGGNDATGNSINTVEIYNTATNIWSSAPSMPTARTDFCCTHLDGEIYCIAGRENFQTSSSYGVMEIYHIESETWRTGEEIPMPLFSAGCFVRENKIYCLGGNDSRFVRLYSPDSNPNIIVQYHTQNGIQLQADDLISMEEGQSHLARAIVVLGYNYFGYRLNNGKLQTSTSVFLEHMQNNNTITFLYAEIEEPAEEEPLCYNNATPYITIPLCKSNDELIKSITKRLTE
ncbi:hypothetical protein LQZ18_17870 [Lachnospiraceae bacterium ZAX-1]